MDSHLRTFRVVGIVIYALLITTVPCAAEIEIVRENEAFSRIVIPDEPLPVVQYAAEELQYHVSEATGATLPIIHEREVPNDTVGLILLGSTDHAAAAGIDADSMPPNAFRISLQDGNLYFVGKDSYGSVLNSRETKGRLHNNRTEVGTLFAVYDFLETRLGVRWLWPGKLGEVIPKRTNLHVSEYDKAHVPQFLATRLRDYANRMGPGWSDTSARERFFIDQAIWMRRHRFAQGLDIDYGHAYVEYWDRFRKSHPEFFAQRPDGKREPAGQAQHVQMCVSQPALWKVVIEDWRQGGRAWINGAENDYHDEPERNKVDPPCYCDSCRAWDVPGNVSLSDRYAKFWLALQHEGQRYSQDAAVIGYAYGRNHQPPVDIRLNDRIIVEIVPAFYFPWTDKVRQQFRDQWEGWADSGARLILRPNYFHDGHNMPMYFADQFGEDFAFAAKRGMMATDFDQLTGQWATQGPNLYMLGRIHTHPEMSPDEVLDEYYAAFGPAEDAVRRYFDHWKQVSDAVTTERYEHAWRARGIPDNPEHRFYRWADAIFTPSVMRQGRELIEEATVQASQDPTATERVAFLEKGLTNAERTLQVLRAHRHYKNTGQDEYFIKAVRALDAYRGSIEDDNVANMGYLNQKESRTWDRSLAQSSDR